jgi:putative membrane protein
MSIDSFAKENKTGFNHTICGFLMGSADVVPGVSGGTIALILGVYERLINAVSSFDHHLFQLIIKGKLIDAFKKVDGGFLVFLGTGVATAVLSLAKLITWLLSNHPIPTWSVFLGLILASSWVVYCDLSRKGFPELVAALIAATFSFWISGMNSANSPDNLLFIFFCGMISICAMVLPGISGSFILVLLGKYETVMHAIKGFDFGVIFAFGAGAALGIITFSKFIKWLLAKYHSLTLAAMVGLMVGSLRKVWPFKIEVEGMTRNVFPDPAQTDFSLAVFLCLAALGLVLVLEKFGKRVS